MESQQISGDLLQKLKEQQEEIERLKFEQQKMFKAKEMMEEERETCGKTAQIGAQFTENITTFLTRVNDPTFRSKMLTIEEEDPKSSDVVKVHRPQRQLYDPKTGAPTKVVYTDDLP